MNNTYLKGSETEKMRISANGNVGIGTTSPDHPLEVQGIISSADAGLQKATFANVGNDLVITANAGATNVTANILFKSSGTGGGTVSEKMRIDGSGNVIVGTTTTNNGTGKLTVRQTPGAPATTGTATTNVGLRVTTNTSNSQALDFGVYNESPYGSWIQAINSGDSSTYPIILNPNGGSVGIGTTSPARALSTKSSSVTIGSFESTSASGGMIGFVDQNTTNDVTVRAGALGNDLVLQAGGYTRMTIKSGGNVGIGTAAPGTYSNSGGLAIKGATAADFSLVSTGIASGANSHQMRYWNDTGTAYEIARTRVNVGAGQVNRGEYQFSVNNGASLRQWLDVDYGGNVRFNEDGNDSDFRVASDSQTHAFHIDGDTGVASIALDLNVGGGVKGNAGSRVVSIGTAGSVIGGLQLWSTTSGQSYVQFGDEAGTAANHYRGHVSYNHTGDILNLGASGATVAAVTSTGIDVTGTATMDGLTVSNAGSNSYIAFSETTGAARLQLTNTGANVLLGTDNSIGGLTGVANQAYIYSANALKIGVNTFSAQQLTVNATGIDVTGAATFSAGVYLGGTGAANLLDDYEEGTWTPADGSGAGLTFSTAVGTYTKVGNLVTVAYSVTYPSTVDTTDMAVSGLPFAPDVNFRHGGSQAYTDKAAAFDCSVTTSSSKIIYRTGGTSAQINNNELSSGSIRGSITYQV